MYLCRWVLPGDAPRRSGADGQLPSRSKREIHRYGSPTIRTRRRLSGKDRHIHIVLIIPKGDFVLNGSQSYLVKINIVFRKSFRNVQVILIHVDMLQLKNHENCDNSRSLRVIFPKLTTESNLIEHVQVCKSGSWCSTRAWVPILPEASFFPSFLC